LCELVFDSWHAGAVAGGMTSRRDGLTLAERSALSGVGRERATGARHCWVSGLPGDQGRWPGLLAEWAQRGGWFGRVVYAVDDGGRVVLVEAWVPAEHLEPAVR
jgi:hypothetical protein